MARKSKVRCAVCPTKECYHEGEDCFEVAEAHLEKYAEGPVKRLHLAAASVEAGHYCKATRLEELILFAQGMGVTKLGLAFCIGLAEEAAAIEKILSPHFKVISVCCKLAGINKRDLDLPQIRPENENEIMCNPAGQADMLNRQGTELNVICGLCVGHDAIFSMTSNAPVTTLIAKDRVLAHNPIGAIYCQYVSRRFNPPQD